MRLEKLILGLLLLPFLLFIVLILLPLILIYGAIMLLLHKPVHYTFRNTSSAFKKTPQEGEEDVIDVEVIHSEPAGEKNEFSGRTLNQ